MTDEDLEDAELEDEIEVPSTVESLLARADRIPDARVFLVTYLKDDGSTITKAVYRREPPAMPKSIACDDDGRQLPFGVSSKVPLYSWFRGDAVLQIQEVPREDESEPE